MREAVHRGYTARPLEGDCGRIVVWFRIGKGTRKENLVPIPSLKDRLRKRGFGGASRRTSGVILRFLYFVKEPIVSFSQCMRTQGEAPHPARFMVQPRPTFKFLVGGLIIAATAMIVVRAPVREISAAPVISSHTLFGKPLLALSPKANSIEVLAPSVTHLKSYFKQLGYAWGSGNVTVPRVSLMAFPADMSRVREVNEKKRLFFQSMLPLVLMENEHVLSDRSRMADLFASIDRGTELSPKDASWLDGLVRDYRLSGSPVSNRDELLMRVNAVPLSLALAMAANESGWGTSRFAEEGNNLFGQWTYASGTGLIPRNRPAGTHHEVAVFPDLASSVRSYVKNLNTHSAYAEFRQARAALPSLSSPDAGPTLARSLTRYSERGTAYTEDLVRLIHANGLSRIEGATLDTGLPFSRASRTGKRDAARS